MATKKTTTKKAPKRVAKPRAKKVAAEPAKKLSQIDAAVRVLADAGEPLSCTAMVEAIQAKGLWSSPGGKTPSQTLYSSILREIATKGKNARFVKADRGTFALKK